MRLIFFRHAIAEDKLKDESGLSDFKRELSKVGIKQTKKVEKMLHRIFKSIDVFFTSPYPRAVATAEILYSRNTNSDFQIFNSLDSEISSEELVMAINALSVKHNYCFVGHEPQLSDAVSKLLGSKESILKLDKSGVIILEGESFSTLKLTAMLAPAIILK